MASGDINITYSIENTKAWYAEPFHYDLQMCTTKQPFINIMQQAARMDPHYRFEYKKYPGLGAYITEINEVKESEPHQLAWMYYTVYDGKRTLVEEGVSSYVPVDGESLLFSLEDYSEHCTDTSWLNHSTKLHLRHTQQQTTAQ